MRRLRTGCSTSDGDNIPNDGAETLPLTKRRACTFDWRNIPHLSENFHVESHRVRSWRRGGCSAPNYGRDSFTPGTASPYDAVTIWFTGIHPAREHD
jgi:hypothetical protein